MPVEMTSAATWLGSAHLRLGACVEPPRGNTASKIHNPVSMHFLVARGQAVLGDEATD